ncbi:zinc-dependent alcohol dehydrogenase family protein [Nakamurella leprariae]|uniref:Zinc-dependent alcohol dehydrogenase family protein n=1 Tax=Nakamurella leprariae TaxID=2803911 RepID=A0A939C276_9ACTN|nr:zinc-dependent alcohol dehydrogenase family protein [Nakamurella leprariae]MBM9467847.1 zinc-dependent alcohol dehydrogenase family protein [Nakamurella leprariae]
MRAVVYHQPELYKIEEVPERPLAAGEVRVRNLVVGVCGTDAHLHVGEFGPRWPLTPGHEIVGEVVEMADDVVDLAVGDRVAVDNTIHCMHCENCKRGDFNFCLNGVALGVQAPGGFAETTIASGTKCYPIGDLDLDAAALIEPTACVVHGLDVLDLQPAADVLIIGAGPTSQILAQLIVHGGASRVTIAAPTQFKLDVAASHGVNQTVLLDRNDFTASADQLRTLAPHGFDAVIEASGAIGVLQHVLPHVKSGGTLMIYGMASETSTIEIHPYEIFRREIQIKGSFAHAYGFARAIQFLRAGKVDPSGIITHRYSLDQYDQALASLRAPGCLKAVVEPQR